VVILDGWGISFLRDGNAIAEAATPMMDRFARHFPTASVAAASMEVGLPWGEVGNSETGHRNIGAGRVQYQSLAHIDKAIASGEFFTNETLLGAIEHVRKNKSHLHLMGLLGTGGVHAHSAHLVALLKFLAQEKFKDRVYIHLFTDGRDAPPQSAIGYLEHLEEAMSKYNVGIIASITGRFYAMDRNANWERTQATYDLLVGGPRSAGAAGAREAIEQAYASGTWDEKIPPTAITRGGGPIATIADNDAVIFFNFRPDRARQLTAAFVDPAFSHFTRSVERSNLYFATMTQYSPDLAAPPMFIETAVDMPLAEVISQANLRQLHIAETEKYAHVTYYLNGGYEKPFPGEEHVLIQSSSAKDFALEPRMMAGEITDKLCAALEANEYDVYFVNYANADMVGHTGNFAAAVEACSFVDQCLGRLYQATMACGGALVVTADHGNAEEMINPQTQAVVTDHTNHPVPLHFVNPRLERQVAKTETQLVSLLSQPIGVLSDVAPTILDILQLPKPLQMTGISLLNSLQ
jgi:2,3-bisphosphoglycerate-independent phosphoglycerate mutase